LHFSKLVVAFRQNSQTKKIEHDKANNFGGSSRNYSKPSPRKFFVLGFCQMRTWPVGFIKKQKLIVSKTKRFFPTLKLKLIFSKNYFLYFF